MQKDPTIATYDKYATVYDEGVIDFWRNFPSEFIDKFVVSLSGKRIVNLGSGSGRDALLLRQHGLDVVCVDASSSMVDITNHLGFESHKMTFAEMDFPKESFDGAWAYTSLIHIPPREAEAAMRAIHGFLKPKGIFAIGAIEGETAGMVEHKTMPNASRYFKKYDRDELKLLVEKCGFKFMAELDYQPHNSVYLNQLYLKVG